MTASADESLDVELARLTQAEREELEAVSTLLAVRDDFEFGPEKLARGQLRLEADLRAQAVKADMSRRARPRWWLWARLAPLPLALGAVLFVTLGREPESSESRLLSSESRTAEGSLPAPPETLVLAQSRALEARLARTVPGGAESEAEAKAAADLERELRTYRGALLARLEASGR